MPLPRSNLPLLLAAIAAAGSVLTLGGVLLWRGQVAETASDHGSEHVPTGDHGSESRATQPPTKTPTQPPTTRSAASTEAILDAADRLVQQGEADRAEAVLRAAVGEQPDDQELRLALAGACVLQRKLAEAYQQYEAALAIGPRVPEVEFIAGTVASQLRRLDRAEEHFSAAQASDPTDARFPLYLAQVQIGQGRHEEARKNLMLATTLDDSLAIAWGTLAQLSLRSNDPNVALGLVRRARELEPSAVVWRLLEARARNRIGGEDQLARALAVLEGLPADQRQRLDVLGVMGESYGLLGTPDKAAREFAAAAAARPDDGELQLETAIWHERIGELDAALGYARRAEALGVEAGAKMAARLAGP
ncbi:MAG: tetratricopeptide repeat protein [Planctomycetota bacterium]|nr:tetratricopeptide repeat protein [Planctomycetota bacterium]